MCPRRVIEDNRLTRRALLAQFLEHQINALHRPVNLLAGDDQRRREAYHSASVSLSGFVFQPIRLDQNVGRQSQPFCEAADHDQGERPLPVQHLGHARTRTDVGFKVFA